MYVHMYIVQKGNIHVCTYVHSAKGQHTCMYICTYVHMLVTVQKKREVRMHSRN
jgi:hypothetical protein